MKPCRYPYIGKDIFAFADGRVIDPHARIIDRGMHDAIWIGLGSPYIIIDCFRKRLARGVEFEDRDDLARLRLLDEVVVVEAPIRRGVGTKAAAGVAGVTTGARPDVQDDDLQYVAGLCILDSNWPSQQMNADAFARPSNKRPLGRTGATANDRLMLAGPMENAFRTRIIGDDALVIVVGVVRQSLDGGAVS